MPIECGGFIHAGISRAKTTALGEFRGIGWPMICPFLQAWTVFWCQAVSVIRALKAKFAVQWAGSGAGICWACSWRWWNLPAMFVSWKEPTVGNSIRHSLSGH